MRHARLLASVAALALSASVVPLHAERLAPDDEPRDLPFSAFFARPSGPLGLEPTAVLRAADGARVRLVGFVVVQETPVAGRWLFAPVPVQMSEHADGDADDLPPATVAVRLPAPMKDRAPPHATGPVTLVGTLHVGREEGPDGRVTWVQLDAEAPNDNDSGGLR